MRAHDFYIGGFKLPITPSSVKVNYKGKNKAIDLLNGDEFNVLNKPSLTSYKFDFFLPRDHAPIVGEYVEPFAIVDGIERIRKDKSIVPFIIIRHDRGLKNSIIKKATIEDFSYDENSNNAPGLMASITLKVYIPIKTKVLSAKSVGGKTKLTEVSTVERPHLDSVTVRANEPLNVAIRRGGVSLARYEDIKNNNDISGIRDDLSGRTIDLR